MATALQSSGVSPSTGWSLVAGVYMFLCGVLTAVALSGILGLFADVIGLPAPFGIAILASPVLLIGAVSWWTVVERRRSYTYPIGGAFGFVTALVAGLLWTVAFVAIWGLEMATLSVVAFLIAWVIGLTAVAGALTGLPLMYARRRLGSELSGGPESHLE